MITIKNKTGTKEVIIIKTSYGFYCSYLQIYKDDQTHKQVLDSKSYKFEKAAIKWANKQLK